MNLSWDPSNTLDASLFPPDVLRVDVSLVPFDRVTCVSLWQPWASLMAAKIGGKTIETRHWTTAVRGTVYIQAAGTKRGIKDCEQIDPEHRAAMEAALKIPFRQWKDRLPFGALVARGNLSSVLPSREALRLRPSQEPFGNFSPGRYGWIFDGIESLKPPIHCKGAQGFFRVSLPHSITREVTP